MSDGAKVDVVEKDRAEAEAKDAAVADDMMKADIKSDTEVPARPRRAGHPRRRRGRAPRSPRAWPCSLALPIDDGRTAAILRRIQDAAT